MFKIFDSPSIKNLMNKILLVFIFYIVTAASFNGIFGSNAFMEKLDPRRSFQAMYDDSAYKPFIYRQLMIKAAKEIRILLPDEVQKSLTQEFQEYDMIEAYHAKAQIENRYAIEYHLLYFICFSLTFLSMFLIRKIAVEITGSNAVGILTACAFTIIFPIIEWLWVYYDCGELFFLLLATLLAIKGYWLALILISPIAEYNKESFLFFVLTLYPLLILKMGKKKAAATVIFSMFFCGVVYLYTASTYAGNIGGNTEWHFGEHLQQFFILNSWFKEYPFYGVYWGIGFFIPNTLMLAWIAKCTWKKLSAAWKNHIKIAALINIPLFFLFCQPNELRNLSLMYIGFIAMLSIFIKEAINIEQKN